MACQQLKRHHSLSGVKSQIILQHVQFDPYPAEGHISLYYLSKPRIIKPSRFKWWEHLWEIDILQIEHSRTCYEQRLLGHRVSGVFFQTGGSPLEVNLYTNSIMGNHPWPPIGDWLLIKVAAHSMFYYKWIIQVSTINDFINFAGVLSGLKIAWICIMYSLRRQRVNTHARKHKTFTSHKVGSMLGQRWRWWANIEPTLGERFVFTVTVHRCTQSEILNMYNK